MSQIINTVRGVVEYRLVGNGPVILVLNGGHTNCNSPFEHEKFFLENGYQIIIPSRPGYGKTPSSSGKTAEGFSHTLSVFLEKLEIEKVIVIGISAAGRTALHFAKNYPEKLDFLILESAVTNEIWPDKLTKLGAYVAFNKFTEGLTWAILRFIGKLSPNTFMKLLLPALSVLDPTEVLNSWDENERNEVLLFLINSRSGAGFLNDINHTFDEFQLIITPTLIIASSYDQSVNPKNSTNAAEGISCSELMLIPVSSHLIWFGGFRKEIEDKIIFKIKEPLNGLK